MRIANRKIEMLAAASLVILALAALWKWSDLLKPTALVWDMRKGNHNIDQVNWPASVTGNAWDQYGDFDLTIIDADGSTIFHERVQHLRCEREGNRRTISYLYFSPRQSGSPGEEAYTTLKKIMTDMKFLPPAFSDLEKWHDGIAGKVRYGDFAVQHEKTGDLFGFSCYEYPGFAAGKPGGNVRLRLTRMVGIPEDGTIRFVYSLSF